MTKLIRGGTIVTADLTYKMPSGTFSSEDPRAAATLSDGAP